MNAEERRRLKLAIDRRRRELVGAVSPDMWLAEQLAAGPRPMQELLAAAAPLRFGRETLTAAAKRIRAHIDREREVCHPPGTAPTRPRSPTRRRGGWSAKRERTCRQCHRSFLPTGPRAVYCSRRCANRADYESRLAKAGKR